MNKLPYEIDYSTLREMIETIGKVYPDNVAFTIKDRSKKKDEEGFYTDITYKQFVEDTYELGSELVKRGFKGERYAVMGEDSYPWILSYFTVVGGAGVLVPVDRTMQIEEIEGCLNRTKVTVFFFDKKADKIVKQIAERENTSVKLFIGLDFKPEYGEQLSTLKEAGKKLIEKEDYSEYINTVIDKNALAIIVFTSGTTAQSKAVMLSNRNITSNIYGMSGYEKMYEDDINMIFLPLHHVYGMTGLMVMLTYGSRNVFCDGLKYIQKNLVEYKVSVFMGVPLIFESMYKKIMKSVDENGARKKFNRALKLCDALDKIGIHKRKRMFKAVVDQLGGNMRFLINGGAALDPRVEKGFSDFGFLVVNGYGLTECSPTIASESHIYRKHGTVGLPLENVEVKIDNPNDKGIGEVIAKGDNIMLGYYENQAATDEVIIDGWYHTGDLGYFDEEGFLWLKGKAKDVIVMKNGKNVFPEELEQLVSAYPYVDDCMVFPLTKRNEFVISVKIVYNKTYMKENDISLEELDKIVAEDIDKINDTLPLYKRIRKHILSDRPMIKTSTAKTKRKIELQEIKRELAAEK